MSKSGLYAHFGSKEELQLAAVDAASAAMRLSSLRKCSTRCVRMTGACDMPRGSIPGWFKG